MLMWQNNRLIFALLCLPRDDEHDAHRRGRALRRSPHHEHRHWAGCLASLPDPAPARACSLLSAMCRAWRLVSGSHAPTCLYLTRGSNCAQPPALGKSLVGWFVPIWRMTDEEFYRHAGLDAYMFAAVYISLSDMTGSSIKAAALLPLWPAAVCCVLGCRLPDHHPRECDGQQRPGLTLSAARLSLR